MSSMTELLTTQEVQELLHVDRTTVYRLVGGGRLPAIRVGKQWRFPRSAVEEWLRASKTPPLEPKTTAMQPASSPGAVPVTLADLLPLNCAQLIQDVFADMLGVMMVITDMRGQPITQVSNQCGLYTAIIQDAEALSRCVAHWQQLAGAVPLEPRFMPSELGLLCARGFIRLGAELKGMVFVGGIAPDIWPPVPAEIAAIATRFGLDPQVVQAQIEAVHHLDKAGQARVLRFVQRIADVFSHMIEDRHVVHSRLQAIASLTAL